SAAALGKSSGPALVERPPTEQLPNDFPLSYVWSYASSSAAVRSLYEKAKREQWDAGVALDWTVAVDPERENMPDAMHPIYGTEIWRRLDDRNVRRLRREGFAWMLSQFLHGEQGALLATAQLALAVPTADAKLYAATQVVDEARHVEVYERYLREKLEL